MGSQSRLLQLPIEIRDIIWVYCIKQHDKIVPVQVQGSGLYDISVHECVKATRTLMSLSRTNRQIHDEVSNSALFYQENEFYFSSLDDGLKYLVTITPMRRNSIRSVTIRYQLIPQPSYGLIMLSTCKGLRHLKIQANKNLADYRLTGPLSYFNGLETFDVEFFEPNFEMKSESSRLWITEVRKMVTSGHLAKIATRKMIVEARLAAEIEISGEDRLEQPDRISSRTRQKGFKRQKLN
jgi:hypothetical protein